MSLGRLKSLMPKVADELETLIAEACINLELDELEVFDKCRCGDGFCAMFYTAPKPNGSWGSSHYNIELSPEKGMMILDVVGERIVAVEILDRPDIKFLVDSAIK